MGSPTPLVAAPLFLLISLLSFAPSPSCSDDLTTFVYAGCSQGRYAPGTPYQYNLNSLLASVANAAGYTSYANFTSSLASPATPVYGLYQCRGDLSIGSCDACVRSAINQLSVLCSSACSAALQLRGCLVRYGNETFLGDADRTLLLKKCGPGVAAGGSGYDPGVVGMRDSVLAGLVSGQGPYRVGRAGNIDGAAQCVGDQNPKQCGDCLAEAMTELKGACGGPASSGEVYLAKCYVTYSYSARGSSSSSSSSGTSSHGKETNKNIAIVVGIAAALLILILLLYFLRRSGKGK